MAIEVHTIEQPGWILALVETVMEAMLPLGFVGPLGYYWWEPGNPDNLYAEGWSVAVFPTAYRAINGAADGGRCVSGFQLDLKAICRAFADIEELIWHAPVVNRGELDGPSMIIAGVFAGKNVRLQVSHLPPHSEPEACKLDTTTGQLIP